MKKFLLVSISFILVSFTSFANDNILADYIDNGVKYFSKDNPKALNLNIEVKYPNDWKAKDGLRPHIVQSFISAHGDGLNICTLLVDRLDASLSKDEWIKVSKDINNIKENFSEIGVKEIKITPTQYDNVPGNLIVYNTKMQQAGKSFILMIVSHNLYYEDKHINLQCEAPCFRRDTCGIYKNEIFPIFYAMGNDIILHTQYEKRDKELKDADTSEFTFTPLDEKKYIKSKNHKISNMNDEYYGVSEKLLSHLSKISINDIIFYSILILLGIVSYRKISKKSKENGKNKEVNDEKIEDKKIENSKSLSFIDLLWWGAFVLSFVTEFNRVPNVDIFYRLVAGIAAAFFLLLFYLCTESILIIFTRNKVTRKKVSSILIFIFSIFHYYQATHPSEFDKRENQGLEQQLIDIVSMGNNVTYNDLNIIKSDIARSFTTAATKAGKFTIPQYIDDKNLYGIIKQDEGNLLKSKEGLKILYDRGSKIIKEVDKLDIEEDIKNIFIQAMNEGYDKCIESTNNINECEAMKKSLIDSKGGIPLLAEQINKRRGLIHSEYDAIKCLYEQFGTDNCTHLVNKYMNEEEQVNKDIIGYQNMQQQEAISRLKAMK